MREERTLEQFLADAGQGVETSLYAVLPPLLCVRLPIPETSHADFSSVGSSETPDELSRRDALMASGACAASIPTVNAEPVSILLASAKLEGIAESPVGWQPTRTTMARLGSDVTEREFHKTGSGA